MSDVLHVGELVEKRCAGTRGWITELNMEDNKCTIKHLIGGNEEILPIADVILIVGYNNTDTRSDTDRHLSVPPAAPS